MAPSGHDLMSGSVIYRLESFKRPSDCDATSLGATFSLCSLLSSLFSFLSTLSPFLLLPSHSSLFFLLYRQQTPSDKQIASNATHTHNNNTTSNTQQLTSNTQQPTTNHRQHTTADPELWSLDVQPRPGGMRAAIKSAQGLCPARACQPKTKLTFE